ncbi:tetratricopeptide repeat protein [Motiliproteus sp. MSK22-1]|uniref:tetratricopeptide repeat protein n=1 Tax=Motiliproteus sp. MSK22-1 TaxID=1897630 RepID=UPI000976328D|nr:tetratricopeptide repeat protein [Motiliproteus sp. MSK22-1]OMH32183.1 hypothetical protein BGP75_15945 [Motiliproteus sp. MSK22-1]
MTRAQKAVLSIFLPVILASCATHDPNLVGVEDRSGQSPGRSSSQVLIPSQTGTLETGNATGNESTARSYPADSSSISGQPSEGSEAIPQPINIEAPVMTVQSKPPSGALLALLEQAESQQQAGNNQRALSSLERAQRIAPRDPAVYLQLSRLRLDMKDYQRAEQLARKGLSLSSGNKQMQRAFNTLLKQIKR